jgi:hypothetical protein
MDPRWQPHLDHQPLAAACTLETRQLLAAGWQPEAAEGWLGQAGRPGRMLVAPAIWHALRELRACVPVRLAQQRR